LFRQLNIEQDPDSGQSDPEEPGGRPLYNTQPAVPQSRSPLPGACRAPGYPELADRRKRDPLVQDLVTITLDFVEQRKRHG
jgi:hypothetical protein